MHWINGSDEYSFLFLWFLSRFSKAHLHACKFTAIQANRVRYKNSFRAVIPIQSAIIPSYFRFSTNHLLVRCCLSTTSLLRSNKMQNGANLTNGHMQQQRNRGMLIVLEGLDRSGKTTQAKLLLNYMQAKGMNARIQRFPGAWLKHLFITKIQSVLCRSWGANNRAWDWHIPAQCKNNWREPRGNPFAVCRKPLASEWPDAQGLGRWAAFDCGQVKGKLMHFFIASFKQIQPLGHCLLPGKGPWPAVGLPTGGGSSPTRPDPLLRCPSRKGRHSWRIWPGGDGEKVEFTKYMK